MGGANLEPYAFVFVHFGPTAVSLQCGRNVVLAKTLDLEMAQKELATEEQTPAPMILTSIRVSPSGSRVCFTCELRVAGHSLLLHFVCSLVT